MAKDMQYTPFVAPLRPPAGPTPEDDGWRPCYPDIVRAIPPLAASVLAATTYAHVLTGNPDFALDNGGSPWRGAYPAEVRGRRPLPVSDLTGYSHVLVGDPDFALDNGGTPWKGHQPDRLYPRAPLLVTELTSVAQEFVADQSLEHGEIGWLSTYPDRIDALRPLHTSDRTAYAHDLEGDPDHALDNGGTPWRAIYPDRIDRRPSETPSELRESLEPVSVPFDPSTARPDAVYPDRLYAALPAEPLSLYVAPIEPPAAAFDPASLPRPIYPDRLHAARAPEPPTAYVGPVGDPTALNPATRPHPIYPDRLYSLPYHIELRGGSAFVDTGNPDYALDNGGAPWRGAYPDRIEARRPLAVADLTGYAHDLRGDIAPTVDGWLGSYPGILLPRKGEHPAIQSSSGQYAASPPASPRGDSEVPTATTTFHLIRNQMASVIEALAPEEMASSLFRFAHRVDYSEFREWAADHPSASFRKFAIIGTNTDRPSATDRRVERRITECEIIIAYPSMPGLYRQEGRRLQSRRTLIEKDLSQIVAAVGIVGSGNYLDGQLDARENIQWDIEDDDPVAFGVVSMTVVYYYDVS